MKCRRGKPLPSLHVGIADWMHPAGSSTLEAKMEMPEENGNVFSFSVLSPHFSGRTRGKGNAENPQRKLEIHLMFPKLEKKKYKMKTDLFHLLASCHA